MSVFECLWNDINKIFEFTYVELNETTFSLKDVYKREYN